MISKQLKQPSNRNIFLLMMALLVSCSTLAQGIRFRNDLDFKQVQALAKRENKGIFIDFYTTWCGPCKHMTRYIFTMDKVGAYMEDNYISIKIQVDSTAADNESVRRWRETARALVARHAIKSYPTMLYLEADGHPVNRIAGAYGSDAFLEAARHGRMRDSGYYALKNRFTAGDRSIGLLRTFALSAKAAGDPLADSAAAIYLRSEKRLFTKDYLAVVQKFTRKTSDPGFKLLMDEPAKVNEILGQGVAQQVAFNIILQSLQTNLPPAGKTAWLKEKYPEKAAQIILYNQLADARDGFDSSALFQLADSYISRYKKEISFEDISGICFAASAMYSDAQRLEQVLQWLEPTQEDKTSNMYPYARAMLFYELNRKPEAIRQIDMAIARAEAFPERMFRAVRIEMVKGNSLKDFTFIAE